MEEQARAIASGSRTEDLSALMQPRELPPPGGAPAPRGASDARGEDEAESSAVAFGWVSADEQAHHRYLLPSIRALLPATGALDVLDLGCGNGYLTGALAQDGHRVTGVDRSPDGIELARRAFPSARFLTGSVYAPVEGPPGGYDAVLASEVIEHLYAPRDFLRNAFACLRPGGALILTTPYHGYWKNLALALAGAWDRHLTVGWDGGHIKFFSPATLAEMLAECGFERPRFRNAGRVPYLWKSMCCSAVRELDS